MSMKLPVKVAKVVNHECGCLAEFVYIGDQFEQYDWHVIPCNSCARERAPGVLEQRAERAWNISVASMERGEYSLAHTKPYDEKEKHNEGDQCGAVDEFAAVGRLNRPSRQEMAEKITKEEGELRRAMQQLTPEELLDVAVTMGLEHAVGKEALHLLPDATKDKLRASMVRLSNLYAPDCDCPLCQAEKEQQEAAATPGTPDEPCLKTE